MTDLKDRQVGLAGLFALGFLLYTLRDRSFQAKAFPTALLAILAVLCVIMIFRKEGESYDFAYLGQVALYGGLLILYVLLLPRIGFILSTSGFLAGFLFLQKYPTKPWWIVLFSIITALVLYFLFARGFRVRLPEILF